MKAISLLAALFLLPLSSKAMEWKADQIVDLTHPYEERTVYWPTEEGFVLQKEFEGMTDKGYFYASNRFSSPEHGGTHLDAPFHFGAGKETVDRIPLGRLVGAAILVDVSAAVEKNRDYQISISDFENWEKANGKIPEGAIVILRTGFSRFWPDRKSYLGTDGRGPEAVKQLRFPGLHSRAAGWLAKQRSSRSWSEF
jgi:kynurenine formamidase